MVYDAREILLKDGRTAVLRTPEVNEAPLMLDYIRTVSGETEFLMRYPDEWDGMTLENEEKWIQSNRDGKGVMIACFCDGIVAGNSDFAVRSARKESHRATVGIAIRKDFWGLGIGSTLFRELISEAKKTDVEILELSLVSTNTRALRLYEKFGFRTVSELPNAFRMKDGSYVSELTMQKELRKR